MKINKITVIVCAVITFISGIISLFFDNTLIQNITSGLFTGFLASLTISMIGYFHERNIIFEKIDSNIKGLYINMMVLSKIIENTLPQIHKATSMEQLPFKNISGLSELNVGFVEKMDLGLFSPFWKWGRLAWVYTELIEFQQVAYNIKNISMNLQLQTMKFTMKTLELKNAQLHGIQPSVTDLENIDNLKNLINIRTAKFHELLTCQTLKIEKIAKSFYDYKSPEQPWETIKKNLMLQIEDIVR